MAISALSAGRRRPVWSARRAIFWVAVLVVAMLAYFVGGTWLILGNDHYHEMDILLVAVGFLLVGRAGWWLGSILPALLAGVLVLLAMPGVSADTMVDEVLLHDGRATIAYVHYTDEGSPQIAHLTDDHGLPIPRPLVLYDDYAWVGDTLTVYFDPQGRVVTREARDVRPNLPLVIGCLAAVVAGLVVSGIAGQSNARTKALVDGVRRRREQRGTRGRRTSA
jgi:hypothetical protein